MQNFVDLCKLPPVLCRGRGDSHSTDEIRRLGRQRRGLKDCPVVALQDLQPRAERRWEKGDCFDFITARGLRLPEMYRLGFNNANCIGCPKGGAGYWNHVRKVFPDHFEAMAALQDELGPTSGFLKGTDGNRLLLRHLPETAGKHVEPSIECGLFCTDLKLQ